MMGLLATTEVRWFSQGIIPDDIQVWFNSLGTPAIQPIRTDIYFPQSNSGIGIKLRDGRLEIKVRRSRHAPKNFAPGVSGHVETWVKWGFRNSGEFRSGLPVEKSRRILYYQVTADGKVRMSTPEIFPEKGGGVELTQVWFDGSPWWTLGIEVFGPRQQQMKVLGAIVDWVFRVDGAPALSSELSVSYSAWLAGVSLRP
jgi:hypothetical protein